MPREALLALVAVAVALNFALVVWALVALRRRAQAERTAVPPQTDVVADPGPDVRPMGRPAPAPAITAAGPMPPAPAIPLAPPRSRPEATPAGPEPTAPAAVPVASTEAPRPAQPEPDPAAEPPSGTADAVAPPAEAPAVAAAEPQAAPLPRPRPTRPRRFVLPQHDEDRGRTERAIQTFLGASEDHPAGTHQPRRRARRRRHPSDTTTVVAAMTGWNSLRTSAGRDAADRYADAFGEAVRGTIRSSDQVTDLGHGRIRLVLHADDEGVQALADRLRTVCGPWLRVAPVPLDVQVGPMTRVSRTADEPTAPGEPKNGGEGRIGRAV